jgi:hypothetical protein
MQEAVAVLDSRISEWRTHVLQGQFIHPRELDELEGRLRGELDLLKDAGLDEDEAFLIAVKRIAELGVVSRELVCTYSEPLWRRLLLTPVAKGAGTGRNTDAMVAVALAIAAAIAFRVPEFFGLDLFGPHGANAFYARNFGFLVLPFLVLYFAWKRSLEPSTLIRVAAPFAAAILVMNLYPFVPGGHTESLSALHVLIALWLTMGYAFCAGQWRDHDRRMHFVRFSGEWFIFYTLIALGGGVLTLLTLFIFGAIGLDAERFLATWVIPCGVAGAVIIAAWLADARQSVIENVAPVLTMLFTPLFTLALLAFLGTLIWTGKGISVERGVLIGFDVLLVVVLGLILYAISARDPQRGPGFFDALQLALVVCALVVDAWALWAILGRISSFGFSPNRVVALGLNLLLVVNLAWAAFLHGRFLTHSGSFTAVVRWQTAYLPVYAAWAWIVVVVFPPSFGFT